MKINRLFKILLTGAVFFGLFAAGIGGSYLFFKKKFPLGGGTPGVPAEFTFLKIYYPLDGRLQMEERRAPKIATPMSTVEAVMSEFLEGPAGVTESPVPEGAAFLGAYPGLNGILYLDFSEELRRNFNGSALDEFLLLRGLYESILTNARGISEVRVLIEGREVESIGGHISLLEPLGDAVSQSVQEAE